MKLKNNQQQQLVNQDTLRPDTASHHYQAPKLHQTSNLQTGMTNTTGNGIGLLLVEAQQQQQQNANGVTIGNCVTIGDNTNLGSSVTIGDNRL